MLRSPHHCRLYYCITDKEFNAKYCTVFCSVHQFFDIVGQERSRILSRTYYKGAAGCFVMFDVTNRGTLEGAQTWKKDLDEKVILPSGSPVPSVLLANKVRLVGDVAV